MVGITSEIRLGIQGSCVIPKMHSIACLLEDHTVWNGYSLSHILCRFMAGMVTIDFPTEALDNSFVDWFLMHQMIKIAFLNA